MDAAQADQVLKSMVAFIRTHGDERVATINKQAEDEFTIQKENYIAEQKEALTQDYRNKLQQAEVKLRIQKSAEQNAARIKKMRTVNQLVEKVYKEAQHKMVNKQNSDKGSYKELLKNLLIQGLIKLMEPEVHIRTRKSDEDLVKQIIEPAVAAYKEIMKKEVKLFKDKDVPCKVVFDSTKYLPEYTETEGIESCMGGIVLHARKGRIVCSNTIDERLSLCYQEGIPEIRRLLFPSFTRVHKPNAPVVKKHH